MVNTLNTDISERTATEEYQAVVRSLRRHKGFGLLFVESTPVGGFDLIKKVSFDLQQKKINVLVLSKAINNLIELVEVFPGQDNLNILFIVGLEKSLVEYIRPGYGGKGDYYNLDTIPPILSHLNWQRENFRDRFRHLCFVFILPKYAIKYISLRAPDFFDWGSGKIQISTERGLIEKEIRRLSWDIGIDKYRRWTSQQRLERLAEIHIYLEENPDRQRKFYFYFEQALILATNGNYEESITSYDDALKLKSDNPAAWHNRGIALHNLGRYDEAIASFDFALKLAPNEYHFWKNRANSLGNLGRYEEAISSFDSALQLKSDDYQAWYGRGVGLEKLGNYDGAIASFDKVLKLKPDGHEACYSRGNALFNLGTYEEAITSFDNALKSKPDYYEAWNNRGSALFNLGRFEEAIASFDNALKFKPDEANPYFNKACAYALQENIPLTIENLKQAINLNSKYLEMAKTDIDFDKIRHDSRFIDFINQSDSP